nr:hypothetical protein T09_13603 [Ipomoea batatas]
MLGPILKGMLTPHLAGSPAALLSCEALALEAIDFKHEQALCRSAVVFAAATRVFIPLQHPDGTFPPNITAVNVGANLERNVDTTLGRKSSCPANLRRIRFGNNGLQARARGLAVRRRRRRAHQRLHPTATSRRHISAEHNVVEARVQVAVHRVAGDRRFAAVRCKGQRRREKDQDCEV